jgi:hypothetical protein
VTDPIPTRRAPADMRLPVPRHVRMASVVLGVATCLLGFVYLTEITPNRAAPLEEESVVAVIELPLGWTFLGVGGWVVIAACVAQARASAHAVAAAVHTVHLMALVVTFFIAYPLQPAPPVITAVFAVIAHGGASLDHWQRGWR